jgi:hypothetical protein
MQGPAPDYLAVDFGYDEFLDVLEQGDRRLGRQVTIG